MINPLRFSRKKLGMAWAARRRTPLTGAIRFAMLVALLVGKVLSGSLVDNAAAAENWPQFRGAESLGTADDDRLPERWSESENVAWKRPLPGRGWSSPIAWGNKIFLTTCVNTAGSEEPTKGLYFRGERPTPESIHKWIVYCLDLTTGEVLWERLAHEGVPLSSIHVKNTFASETPVTDGQRVYAYFGNLGIYCYDLDGKALWSKKFEPHQTRNGWGTAASPVVSNGRVFIVDDNEEASFIVALDAATGSELWRESRDEKTNWATPYVWKNDLREELITAGTNKIRSYDLDGKLLWELGGMSSITIPTPFAGFGMLYLSSGYVMDKQKPIYAVRPGASGDISLTEAAPSNPSIAWHVADGGPYNTSPLLYGDYLYVLLDRGMLSCYDAHTGEAKYEKQRLPEGRAFTASPWAYRGKVFSINEFGVTFVVEAGPEFKLLYTNELASEPMCMSTPAMVGDRLLLRTASELVCFQAGARLAEPATSEPAQ